MSLYPARVLIGLVRDMRQAQKHYFRSKSPAALKWAMKAERKVDALLYAIDETNCEPSQQWEKEKALAGVMGVRDDAQWLYELEAISQIDTIDVG